VIVEDVKLASSLAVLSSRLAAMLRKTPPVATRVVREPEKSVQDIKEPVF